VLFSEPKIPQYQKRLPRDTRTRRFSALQRAENSSIEVLDVLARRGRLFQCSSASRKFLNRAGKRKTVEVYIVSVLFSEPKIPQSSARSSQLRARADVSVLFSEPKIPQYNHQGSSEDNPVGFSALQRAENSSIVDERVEIPDQRVSVLFSEPKIPQLYCWSKSRPRNYVSVLFSEPKIPQSQHAPMHSPSISSFSALQRAENSSMYLDPQRRLDQ